VDASAKPTEIATATAVNTWTLNGGATLKNGRQIMSGALRRKRGNALYLSETLAPSEAAEATIKGMDWYRAARSQSARLATAKLAVGTSRHCANRTPKHGGTSTSRAANNNIAPTANTC
jgi:hypothetical protein